MACHLKCIPEYVREKVYKDLSATLYPKVSVCNLGYSRFSPGPKKKKKNVGQRQSIIKSVSYTVPRYSRLSPGVHTQIPVSDKVYKHLSATLLPSILVFNLGYSGQSPGVYTYLDQPNTGERYLAHSGLYFYFIFFLSMQVI